jgi:hypothetical protein
MASIASTQPAHREDSSGLEMGAAVVERAALGVPTAVSDAAEVRVLYTAGIRRGMTLWAAGHSPAPPPPNTHTPTLSVALA